MNNPNNFDKNDDNKLSDENPVKEPEFDVDKLISENFTDSDKNLVREAFDFAYKAHMGVSRKSGEPYFIHPYKVALILKELNMDAVTIISGLLHDTIEDVDSVTTETIKNKFGSDVTKIVYGVTKITNLKYHSRKEKFNENLRKMVIFMAKDIRVIIVKLADRLHNMRTLDVFTNEKQERKSLETREVYAPLANRLGMYKIKSELEDLCMRYLERDVYQEISQKINMKSTERNKTIQDIRSYLETKLKEKNLKHFKISGRTKHYYSIYRKMKKGYTFEEIYDLSALRIITRSVGECYRVLGMVHQIWNVIPNRFKDYIGAPKENGYQSIHTTVITHTGKLVEVQIRTQKMHEIAEEGIAAHWKYKEGVNEKNNKKYDLDYIEKKLRWVRRIKNWAEEMKAMREGFVEGFKMDILEDQILCFTPQGEVIDLPQASTPIDFAYAIHTEVGKRCVGARVTRNDVTKIVPLNSILHNFDKVEIITKNNAHPGKDWLTFVKTGRARNKIKQWFKSSKYREYLERGRENFFKALRELNISIDSPETKKIFKYMMKSSGGINTEEGIYADIGFNGVSESDLVKKFKQYIETKKKKKKDKSKNNNKSNDNDKVIIEGMKGIPIKFAKCCNPIAGDDIYGFITRIKGISIHKSNCKNFHMLREQAEKNNETSRIIKAYWNEKNVSKPMRINVITQNSENVLAEIYNTLTKNGATIININTHNISNHRKKLLMVIRGTSVEDEKQKYLRVIKENKYVIKANIEH